MGQLYDAFINFLNEEDWPFAHVEDGSIASLGFQGENGQWMCYAQTVEEYSQFLFYSILPVQVPESKRQLFAELLTRANFGLVVGNFEMDLDDGELRFKTSLDVTDDRLSAALIANLINANVSTMDTFLPVLLNAIYADVSATEFMKQIESEDA